MYRMRNRFIPLLLCLVLVVSMFITVGIQGANAAAPEWGPNVDYAKGDLVTYQGKLYLCQQPHKSITGWEPPNVASLWQIYTGPTPTPPPTMIPTNPSTGCSITGFVKTDFSTDQKAGFNIEAYGIKLSTMSDINGFFEIKGLSENSMGYRVRVSKAGYLARNIENVPGSGNVIIGSKLPIDVWAGDINQDGVINMADIMEVSKVFNSITGDGKYNVDIDINKDSAINMADVMVFVRHFNSTTSDYPTVTDMIVLTPSSSSTPTPTPTSGTPPPSGIPSKVLVGYWHNFENGTGVIKLRDISPDWDVINLSFGEPTSLTSGVIEFKPINYTDEEFKADVAYLKSKGKKVLLSIGGEKGATQLPDDTARNNFIDSVTTIIEKYGLDGLDIDFEGKSLYLNAGDSDLKNPQTPVVVNLIKALRTLHDHFGNNFMLTMAPETFYVQLGYTTYGGNGGTYLPVLYACRDILSWLQVQYYNSGPITGPDNQYHTTGGADFLVVMTDMTINGFPLNGNPNNFFPGLRPDQVVIGLPSCVNAAGSGYLVPSEVHKALDYLIKGVAYPGAYQIKNPSGYPSLRGLMTWSINWDAFQNKYEFSKNHRAYFDSLQ